MWKHENLKMLRDVILKHFLRLVYMRKFLIYMFMMVLPALAIAQEEDSIFIDAITVDFNNPKVGQLVRFQVWWNLDSSNIRYACIPTLDSLLRIANKDSNFSWEVGAHTDCRASTEYNKLLSQRRAQDVANYLLNKGFNKNRLKYYGYGENALLNDCKCDRMDGDLGISCSEEQHQQNRRLEFVLIDIKHPEIYMRPPTEGKIDWNNPQSNQFIRIPQYNLLFFKPDSAFLVGGFKFLDSLADNIKQNPGLLIELSVHSDCRSSKQFNLTLTQERAENIKKYFVEKGVNPSLLIAKGYGEKKLLNKCACEPNNKGKGVNCSEYEHLQNRRIEFKIIAIKKQ